MDELSLLTLSQSGESDTLEFKSSTQQLKAALQTLCAFLNHKGGHVLLGVNNNGQLVGQKVSDATLREIANEIKKIEPPATVHINNISIKDDQSVIVMQVAAGNHIPYIYDGRPYQRIQSTTSQMPQHLYEQLLVKRGQLNYVWEEVIAEDYTAAMLDEEEIARTVAEGIQENRIPASAMKENTQEILQRLGLRVQGQLNRAAVVLFAKEVFPAFPHCMIKMARFKGQDKLGDFIDNQQVYGNAFTILKEADVFLRRHLPIASVFKPDQFERIDSPALPILAIREALINAICHRDYANRAGSISLALYDDRLELWNNGTLPSELNIEDLKHRHDSLPRNRLISKVFHARGFIETWGTGTNKMVALCRQARLPEPSFEEYSGGFSVVFKFASSLSVTSSATLNESALKQTLEKIEQVINRFYSKDILNSRQIQILFVLLKQGEASLQQIIAQLETPPTSRMVRKDLNDMKQKGIIILKGAARSSHWELSDTFNKRYQETFQENKNSRNY